MRDVDVDESHRRPGDFAIAAIRFDGFDVGVDRFLPTSATNVDVRRHMHVVGEAGLQGAQTIGGRGRPFRMRRSFDRVDVKMIGEWMFRIEL